MLFLTSCSDLVSVLRLCCQKSSAIASGEREKCRKMWDFRKFLDFLKFLDGFSYTRPPRGNQVGDLPRALHTGSRWIGRQLCQRRSIISDEFFDILMFVLDAVSNSVTLKMWKYYKNFVLGCRIGRSYWNLLSYWTEPVFKNVEFL